MKYDSVFLNQLKIVIEILDERLAKEPERPVLKTLYSHYQKAIEVVTSGDDLKKISIKGSMRAYLDSYSDYMNPILQEMGKAERMLDDHIKGEENV